MQQCYRVETDNRQDRRRTQGRR